MKNLLSTVFIGSFILCISLLSTDTVQGQFIVNFSQGASSDYFYNVNYNFNMDGDFGCDCTGNEDFWQVTPSPSPYFTRSHSSASWSGTESIGVGPVKSDNLTISLGNNATNDFFGDCTTQCLFGDVFATQGPVAFATDALYPPDNLNFTSNPDGSITLTWDVITDIPDSTYEIFLFNENFSNVVGISDKSIEEYTFPCSNQDDIYSFYTRYQIGSNSYILSDIVTLSTSPTPARGNITGTIHTKSCVDVTGIEVVATLLNPNDLTNSACWPAVYKDTTDSQGEYSIEELYTGIDGNLDAMYKVEAVYPDHQFRKETSNCAHEQIDSIYTVNLTYNASNAGSISFVDITSYAISGQVTLEGTSCGLSQVFIIDNTGLNSFPPVFTDSEGNYAVVVPEGNKNYELKAAYFPGTINDSVITVSVVEDDVSDIDFLYTKNDTLFGFVGAGCNEFIGQASLEIRSPNGCVIRTVTTDQNGFYEEIVPSGDLRAEITGINLSPTSGLTDEGAVLSGFGGLDTILVDSTTEANFIYRRPIEITMQNLPVANCGAIPLPILKQSKQYLARLKFTEGDGICLVDTGYVVINDNISGTLIGGSVEDTVFIQHGYAYYNIKPGDPNFLGNYSKTTSFTAYIGEEIVSSTYSGIVVGTRQRGSEFVTAAPSIVPFLILRDPYGDKSYSKWTTGTKITTSHKNSLQLGGGLSLYLKAGPAFNFFALQGEATIKGSFSVNRATTNTDEIVNTLTTTQSFSTSNNPKIIGQKGDVFVGASYNFIYAIADELKLDALACAVLRDTTLLMSPDSFATQYIYTDHHIRNTLIPQLQLIADNAATSAASRRQKLSDIYSWNNILQLNEDLKRAALRNATNYSFDGALGTFGTTVEATNSNSHTFESKVVIDIGVAAEMKLKGLGQIIEGGVEVRFKTEIGRSRTTSITQTTKTEYFVDDQNVGDAFTMDIGIDPVYATPAFKLRAGRSSCPHEAPTARRDLMSAEVIDPIQEIPAGTNTAFFDVNFFNFSETDETRAYKLELNPLSVGGAEVYSGSNNFTDPLLFSLNPGVNFQDNFIRVVRGLGLNSYDFEGIEFYLYPACYSSYLTASERYKFNLSAFFENSCSNIDMQLPLNNWIVNSDNNDQLTIQMSGYDLSNDFESVALEYTLTNQVGWITTDAVKTKAELLVGSTTFDWNIPADVADGEYHIRFKLQCGTGVNTIYSLSNRTTGIINRAYPLVLAAAQPTSSLYFKDSEISATFNEELNLAAFQPGDYYLRMIPQNVYYPISIQGDGPYVEIILMDTIHHLINQSFEVGLIAVEDMYGNERPDTVSWLFRVSEPDEDLDGVPDSEDICPGGDDLQDTDLGGLPDDCDCMPSLAFNDDMVLNIPNENNISIELDGVDDQFEIPYNPVLDLVNDFTLETWLKLDDVTGDHTVFQKGFYPNSPITVYLENGRVYVQINDASLMDADFEPFVQNSQWFHLSVSRVGAHMKIYINGVLVESDSSNGLFINNTLPARIGFDSAFPGYELGGELDEFRYWSVGKDSASIVRDMSRELSGSEQNLVLYYNFNQGAAGGNNAGLLIEDQSINGLDATPINMALNGGVSNWVSSSLPIIESVELDLILCKNCPTSDSTNTAMDFDGMDDFISIPNDPVLIPTTTNAVTYEAWIYSNGDNNNRVIFSNGFFGPTANFNANFFQDKLTIVHSGATVKSSPIIIADKWTHVAIVFNLNQVDFYFNGAFDSSSPISLSPNNLGNPTILGNVPGAPPNHNWNGQMDDVRIWDHARTAEEIQENFQAERTGNEPGLVAYYDFNQGIPNWTNLQRDTIHDATGNEHLGILSTGFAKSGYSSNWVDSPFQFADSDNDGSPNLCDDCFNPDVLTLDNEMINGIYYAEKEIILGPGVQMPNNASIELKAPIVKVLDPLTITNTIGSGLPLIRISNEKCPVSN